MLKRLAKVNMTRHYLIDDQTKIPEEHEEYQYLNLIENGSLLKVNIILISVYIAEAFTNFVPYCIAAFIPPSSNSIFTSRNTAGLWHKENASKLKIICSYVNDLPEDTTSILINDLQMPV